MKKAERARLCSKWRIFSPWRGGIAKFLRWKLCWYFKETLFRYSKFFLLTTVGVFAPRKLANMINRSFLWGWVTFKKYYLSNATHPREEVYNLDLPNQNYLSFREGLQQSWRVTEPQTCYHSTQKLLKLLSFRVEGTNREGPLRHFV